MLTKKKLNKKYWFVIFLFPFLFGCEREEKKIDYAAKVNDVYLTQDELSNFLSDPKYSQIEKTEFVNEWVEKEVLFQEAIEEGITDSEEYKRIVRISQRELAVAFYLKKFTGENFINPTEKEYRNYYEKVKNDFKCAKEIFILDICEFDDRLSALNFRSELLYASWDTTVSKYLTEKEIKKYSSAEMKTLEEIYDTHIKRAVSGLEEKEISIVVKSEQNHFVVVQVRNKFSIGEILPYEYVKEDVRQRVTIFNKRKLIKEKIEELYNQYELEIKR